MTDIHSEWSRCKDWIEAALPKELYNIEDIEDGIASGSMQFWPCKRSAAVTEYIAYPNCRALNILAVGGEKGPALKELTKELEPCIAKWAEASDCKIILAFGIKDEWKSIGEGLGYRKIWTVYAKDIE